SPHRLSPCSGRDKASLQNALPHGTFAHVRFGTKVRWPALPEGPRISFPTQKMHPGRDGRPMFRGVIAAIIAVALAPLSLSATTVLPTSFDDLVREAATIVRAETTEVHSEWRDGAAGREIVTKVTLRVQRSLKGNAPTLIELVFLGGTIGDTTLELSERP